MNVSEVDEMGSCNLEFEMLMVFQIDWIEVEFFTSLFLAIIGQ